MEPVNYELLFSEKWKLLAGSFRGSNNPPAELDKLFSASPSPGELEKLVASDDRDPRLRLIAASRLRELGRTPANPAMLGVVVESHSGDNKYYDLLAAYADCTMRIYPASGRVWMYDAVNVSVNGLVQELLIAADQASAGFKATTRSANTALKPGSYRISYLWTDGIRISEGLLSERSNEPMAAVTMSRSEALSGLFASIPQRSGDAPIWEQLAGARDSKSFDLQVAFGVIAVVGTFLLIVALATFYGK